MMIRHARWVLLVSIVAGVGIWGYFQAQGRGSVPKYRTAVVERGPLTVAVSATGTVNAVITVQVGSQVSGQIKELLADFNTRVERGQVIARLDPELFQARVDQAQADLESSRATVINQVAQLERARADVDNAEAALAEGKANTLKARVTALDSKRDLDRKSQLASRELIARSDLDTAQATYDAAGAFLDASLTGRVTQIRQAAQNVQNVITYTVVVDVANPGGKLLPGMTANVKVIVAEKSNVLKVQNVALRFRPGEAGAGTGAPAGAALPRELVAGDARADGGQLASSAESTSERLTRELGLSDEQRARIDSILKTSREQRRALREGSLSGTERKARSRELREGARARIREVLTAEQRARYDEIVAESGSETDSGTPGRVWVLGADGKPKPVAITLGLTDGSATEVLQGDLKEGQ